MLGNKPPYTTMQQLNLDWVLSKMKTLLRLVPDDGAVGQILRRTRDGAVWSDEQGGGGGGAVESVNGQTGAVVLDAADVGALPDDYTPPVTSVNGQTGAVTVSVPVQSVNGKTGAVVLDADDVGALPDDYTPPVTSVNGQTGAVVDVDYIIEQATSGIWTYRKWNSGIVESWTHIKEGTINMTTAEGSGYYAPLNTYSLPASLFISISVIEKATSLRGALGDFTISDHSVNSVSGYWWATKSTSRQPDLWLHVIGMWK